MQLPLSLSLSLSHTHTHVPYHIISLKNHRKQFHRESISQIQIQFSLQYSSIQILSFLLHHTDTGHAQPYSVLPSYSLKDRSMKYLLCVRIWPNPSQSQLHYKPSCNSCCQSLTMWNIFSSFLMPIFTTLFFDIYIDIKLTQNIIIKIKIKERKKEKRRHQWVEQVGRLVWTYNFCFVR